jgi:hypothetical protein
MIVGQAIVISGVSPFPDVLYPPIPLERGEFSPHIA